MTDDDSDRRREDRTESNDRRSTGRDDRRRTDRDDRRARDPDDRRARDPDDRRRSERRERRATDGELGALDDGDLERLRSLAERAARPGVLDPEEVDEVLAILEDAGLDLDARELDDEALERRLTDALKIASLLVGARANVRRELGQAGIRTGARLLDAVVSSESPVDVLEETRELARDEFERLGLDLGRDRDRRGRGRRERADDAREERGRGGSRRRDRRSDDGAATAETLRERGNRLLDQSADVDHEEPVHPAYARMLDELAPDEARILRLLAEEGPQPAMDVRDKGWLPLGSELVASDLTMLGTNAGCRYEDRTAAYVTNLQRLGLIWIADEPLADLKEYQVLEAQPPVERAMESARRASTVPRSVHLTPLGVDFCRTVFPLEVDDDHSSAGYVPPDDES